MSSAETKRLLTDLSRDDLIAWCADQNEPAFRADQIRRWIFGKRITSFDQMHDVPARLRSELDSQFQLFACEVTAHQIASDRTEKLLRKTSQGEASECGRMRERSRHTL